MDYDAHLTLRRRDTVYRPSWPRCDCGLRDAAEDLARGFSLAARHDTAETLAIFRRQRTIILAMAAMLLAAVILFFAVSHVVTD